ncbi:DUF892 family protein [Mucilaginibacter terrigena]|uniref:DUF892 family protein n=1 Tax=Mucilaginibacter terrigena TaxID=2492395 RepID=A0A4Q5LPS3_9SPHI|nr:DUF892 family protein [Mucilaginibacter terrigena]RYU91395.1 DUF892 family protein [Mucilaginibacter terrigena]
MSKSLDTIQLRSFLFEHLNREYCAKSHLLERLSELEEQSHFEDLKDVIKETTGHIEDQVQQLNGVYKELKLSYTFEHCEALINFLEDAFININRQSENKAIRNAFVLSYLYYIESLEVASLRLLILVAKKLGLTSVLKIFTETYTDTKSNQALILHLTEESLF